jgi:hypothetical protein
MFDSHPVVWVQSGIVGDVDAVEKFVFDDPVVDKVFDMERPINNNDAVRPRTATAEEEERDRRDIIITMRFVDCRPRKCCWMQQRAFANFVSTKKRLGVFEKPSVTRCTCHVAGS